MAEDFSLFFSVCLASFSLFAIEFSLCLVGFEEFLKCIFVSQFFYEWKKVKNWWSKYQYMQIRN